MTVYDKQTLTTTVDLAAVAAFAHADAGGIPHVEPVTPLLLDGSPAFTLSYAHSDLARRILASSKTALVFSDSRLAYVGWSPLQVTARVEVVPDPEGRLFREELMHQELRKFPPDSQLIGSMILQRENWWYLPRWIVRLVEAGEPHPVTRRTGPDHGVLAFNTRDALAAETVSVEDWKADRIPVRSFEPYTSLPPEDVPAALFCYDFATPDMDPRTSFLARGRLANGRLSVRERSGSITLDRRPGLLTRWRAQRELERRCKAGLQEHA
ncbi:hypothetical protein BH18ACT11_BH18ACT11_09630 [soil metagenome]